MIEVQMIAKRGHPFKVWVEDDASYNGKLQGSLTEAVIPNIQPGDIVARPGHPFLITGELLEQPEGSELHYLGFWCHGSGFPFSCGSRR